MSKFIGVYFHELLVLQSVEITFVWLIVFIFVVQFGCHHRGRLLKVLLGPQMVHEKRCIGYTMMVPPLSRSAYTRAGHLKY